MWLWAIRLPTFLQNFIHFQAQGSRKVVLILTWFLFIKVLILFAELDWKMYKGEWWVITHSKHFWQSSNISIFFLAPSSKLVCDTRLFLLFLDYMTTYRPVYTSIQWQCIIFFWQRSNVGWRVDNVTMLPSLSAWTPWQHPQLQRSTDKWIQSESVPSILLWFSC